CPHVEPPPGGIDGKPRDPPVRKKVRAGFRAAEDIKGIHPSMFGVVTHVEGVAAGREQAAAVVGECQLIDETHTGREEAQTGGTPVSGVECWGRDGWR